MPGIMQGSCRDRHGFGVLTPVGSRKGEQGTRRECVRYVFAGMGLGSAGTANTFGDLHRCPARIRRHAYCIPVVGARFCSPARCQKWPEHRQDEEAVQVAGRRSRCLLRRGGDRTPVHIWSKV